MDCATRSAHAPTDKENPRQRRARGRESIIVSVRWHAGGRWIRPPSWWRRQPPPRSPREPAVVGQLSSDRWIAPRGAPTRQRIKKIRDSAEREDARVL